MSRDKKDGRIRKSCIFDSLTQASDCMSVLAGVPRELQEPLQHGLCPYLCPPFKEALHSHIHQLILSVF